jgi:hypothetical protein
MGFITFKSRLDDHHFIREGMFWGSDDDEWLNDILVGDTVVLMLDIDEELYHQFSSSENAGIRTRKKPITPSTHEVAFGVEIDFCVIGRSHYVSRDWMLGNKGFRSSGTSVFLEAVSDEGEALFIRLQKQNDCEQYEDE